MNITYLWTAPSGYLSACVAELARRGRYAVSLLTQPPSVDAPFENLPREAPWHRFLSAKEQDSYPALKAAVQSTRPDVIVIAGWARAAYVRLIHDPSFSHVGFVLAADTPIRFDLRQFLAPIKLGRLFRSVDAICVPGERGYQVMRYWRVPERKIHRLLYGIDYRLFSRTTEWRWAPQAAWPRNFVYAGRYAPVKGLGTLVEAYRRYRDSTSDPWTLTCCGDGRLKSVLSGEPGIIDKGFQQPERLATLFQESGAFVLPSTYEPWGQVIVEAAAAGMPLLCTQACGAAPEMVRHLHNGLLVPTDDPSALAEAFRWMHANQDRLPSMGAVSQTLARSFSAEAWAENQEMLFDHLVTQAGGQNA